MSCPESAVALHLEFSFMPQKSHNAALHSPHQLCYAPTKIAIQPKFYTKLEDTKRYAWISVPYIIKAHAGQV